MRERARAHGSARAAAIAARRGGRVSDRARMDRPGSVAPSPSLAGSIAVAAACLLVWWAVASLRFGGRALIATPWATLRALPGAAPLLGIDLAATLGRGVLGLAIGTIAGIVVGLAAAAVVRRAPIVEGLLDVARSVPPVVLLPVFLLGLGWNDGARVATVAAGCLWTMALAVTTAARAPRSGRRELLALAGATRLQILAWTQPWESLGVLVVGLRSAASTAIVVTVVTEMLAGADHGIGSRVVTAQVAGDSVELTAAILAIGVTGWAINLGLRHLEARARAVTG